MKIRVVEWQKREHFFDFGVMSIITITPGATRFIVLGTNKISVLCCTGTNGWRGGGMAYACAIYPFVYTTPVVHARTYRSRRRRAVRSWNDTKTRLMFVARYLQRNSRLLTRVPYTDGLMSNKMFVALTRENSRTSATMHGVSGNCIYSRVLIEY